VSRRVLAIALVAAVVLAGGLAAALARRSEDGGPPSGSTLRGTWVDRDGNGVLERGRGEPLADRTELAPAARPGRTLATLAILTDAHVRDEESPARAAQLDRLGPPFESTFRPQEALGAQVLAGAVRSINRLRPDSVLQLGDLADNPQQAELDTALAVLGGGRVDPSTGARRYDGPQEASNPDPLFYRPDVDAPRHPGLLARAQRAFASPRLRAPIHSLPGNHDLLVDGEVPVTSALRELAVGDRLPEGLDPELLDRAREERLTPQLVDEAIRSGLERSRPVPADPRRRLLSAQEVVRKLGADGPSMDSAFDVGERLRVIALDTTGRDGGYAVTPEHLELLRSELGAAGDRRAIVMTHRPLRSTTGGDRVLALLDRSPSVVATLAGDTHRNAISPRRSEAGGYWQIETASLADYPQQTRALRLRETAGGGVVLETWMLDTASTLLTDTARALSYIDAQGGRPAGFAGRRADRNARLYKRP
jgi:hypothetical protein